MVCGAPGRLVKEPRCKGSVLGEFWGEDVACSSATLPALWLLVPGAFAGDFTPRII